MNGIHITGFLLILALLGLSAPVQAFNVSSIDSSETAHKIAPFNLYVPVYPVFNVESDESCINQSFLSHYSLNLAFGIATNVDFSVMFVQNFPDSI